MWIFSQSQIDCDLFERVNVSYIHLEVFEQGHNCIRMFCVLGVMFTTHACLLVGVCSVLLNMWCTEKRYR